MHKLVLCVCFGFCSLFSAYFVKIAFFEEVQKVGFSKKIGS